VPADRGGVSRFARGRVVAVDMERAGLQRLRVQLGDGIATAFALTELIGSCEIDDQVILNTVAVELGLGSGGDHIVHWNLSRETLEPTSNGHLLKLRYTSLQFPAGTDELDHPECDSPLGGAVVVACTLHSQLRPVVAGIHAIDPTLRIAFVQTDGGALPLALSDDVAELRSADRLVATVTAGHAFGGELEALTVASALAMAVHVGGADVVVAGLGPGVAGTGTTLGNTALDAVGVIDTTVAIGGTSVLCARISEADPRKRHRGLSHHTSTVARLSHATPLVARSPGLPPAVHGVEIVEPDRFEDLSTVSISSVEVPAGHRMMGRTRHEDPSAFEAAICAGVLAARLTRSA